MLKKIFFYPALFIICWVYAIHFNSADYDFWARIAAGKMFLQTGNVLNHDVFSYTLTKQWIDHEWGSGVIFYFFSDTFADIGILGLKIALMFSLIFLISRIIKLHNPEPDAHKAILFYFIIILATFTGLGHTIRCQLLTFTFFTLWIYILERVRLGESRLLWIMPVTMLIWANVHGGFVAGLGLLFIYGVGELLNNKPHIKYFIALVPSALITLVNPYGFKYLQYIFYATTMDRWLISEWQPTELFGSWYVWIQLKVVILIVIAAIIYYFVKNRPKYNEVDKVKYLLLGVTFYLAMSHIKHQPFFVITAASLFYHDFFAIFKDRIPNIVFKLKDGLVYLTVILCGAFYMAYTPIFVKVAMNKFPVSSVEFIRQNNLKGNIVSIFHWGSYIAWKLYPNCLIALDGRYEEVYPDKTFYDVNALLTYRNKPEKGLYWYNFLETYDTDIIIAAKNTDNTKKTYEALSETEAIKKIYDGPISAVFIKESIARDDYIKPKLDYDVVVKDKYKTGLDFTGGE